MIIVLKYVLKNVLIGMLIVLSSVGVMFTLNAVGLSFETSRIISAIYGVCGISIIAYCGYKGIELSVTKIK